MAKKNVNVSVNLNNDPPVTCAPPTVPVARTGVSQIVWHLPSGYTFVQLEIVPAAGSVFTSAKLGANNTVSVDDDNTPTTHSYVLTVRDEDGNEYSTKPGMLGGNGGPTIRNN
jgi:hypothetical protein